MSHLDICIGDDFVHVNAIFTFTLEWLAASVVTWHSSTCQTWM